LAHGAGTSRHQKHAAGAAHAEVLPPNTPASNGTPLASAIRRSSAQAALHA
jgi:hypothetical protein